MFFSGFSPPRGGPALARPIGLGRGADLTLLIPKPEKLKSQNTPVNQRRRRRRGGRGGPGGGEPGSPTPAGEWPWHPGETGTALGAGGGKLMRPGSDPAVLQM